MNRAAQREKELYVSIQKIAADVLWDGERGYGGCTLARCGGQREGNEELNFGQSKKESHLDPMGM